MDARRRGLLGILTAGLGLGLLSRRESTARAAQVSPNGAGIEGTWMLATRGGDSRAPGHTMQTYTTDGVNFAQSSNRSTTSALQGVWVQTGEREFASTLVGQRYGDDGAWAGLVKVRANIRLNAAMDELTSTTISEAFDLAGNAVRTPIQTTNVLRRLAVEPV